MYKRFNKALIHAVLIASTAPAFAQPPGNPPPPPVVSPEIAASRDVTLRLRAPQADRVELVSGGDIPSVPFNGGLPLTKGGDGVWQVRLPSLAAGAYRYRFNVDGVPTGDPSNPLTSQSNANAWSLFYVPGAAFMDTQRVAHGAVAAVTY
jgi:enterochelin esterase family protein